MRKRFILSALLAAAGVLGYAQQTMWVHTGHVHWAYNTDAVGTMPYSSPSQLTVLGKGFTLADVDSITVNGDKFADNNVFVQYSGNSADVYVSGNIAHTITATVNGAHVNVSQNNTVATEYTYTLQGTSENGSFYHGGSYKMTLILNGVTLTNPDSAAINIQNGKRIAVQLSDGTTNALTDGSGNSKKATFLIKGHAEFSKGGSLTLTGNKKHALACNEYLELKKTVGSITVVNAVADAINVVQYFQMNGGNVTIQSAGDDGIQVDAEDPTAEDLNGHVLIKGGTLTINGSGAATKGIKAQGTVFIEGGTVDITHSGNAMWDTKDLEIKSAMGISSDRNITVNGETAVLNVRMTGNGARGLKCDSTFTASLGTVDLNCSGQPWAYGTTDTTNVKCVKADVAVVLDGADVTCTTTKDEAEGIHSEGTVLVSGGTLTLNTYDHGMKCDGDMTVTGGTINFTVTGAASKALKPTGNFHITGGTISGTVSGGGEKYNDNSASACACIKSNGSVVIDGGTMNLRATGAGGKGINCDGTLTINDGEITVTTTGAKYGSSGGGGGGWNPWGGDDTSSDGTCSAKGIRADGNIDINGGNIKVTCTGGEGSEGIESKRVMTINGGYIYANTYDDCLNSASHMYVKGGYIYAVSTNNDGLDANGNMYISAGNIMAKGAREPELALDANTEGGFKLYISGGNIIAIGGIERGASLTQSCYQTSSWTGQAWYALYGAGNVAFAFKTPAATSGGGGGPGGGSRTQTMVVSAPATCSLKSGVTASGTSFWEGNGYTNATGGSSVTLSSYSGGGGW